MIYFLDGNQEIIKIVRSSAVISAIQTQELPEDNSLLRDYLSVRLKNDERLFNAQYMAIKTHGGNRNAFDLYRIASELVPDNATEFMGVQVAPYELEGVVIEDLRPQNRPLNQTMNQVLEGSDWRIGYVADNLPNVTTNFYYMSVKDALKKIQELTNVEMLFKVEISGNKITDKWVEVYHQLGNRTMKRFNYGTNALSVVRESSHDELYTALIGRGKGEEVGETESGDATYGRKINFANVEWKKSAGKPVDKPKGQKYIELPNATAEYGIKLLDGRKVPRIGIVEFSETDDPEKLIQETYQELLVRARPKVLFKASVINTGDMLIGDTVTIHRHDLDFHYQARVRKVVRDRKNNNKTQVEIGDVVHTPSTKRQGQINSALNNVASDLENVRGEVTEARQSANGKNTNFYGNVEPDRKKVGDTWFRDHPSLTGESQILVWDGEAWELIMDTSDTTKNADAIKEQQKLIDEAKEVADEALSEIDVAIRNAGFTSLDDTIKSVQSRANTAFDTANNLIGEVSGYSQTVDGFNQTVNNYTNQVANFRHDVDGFSSTVASYSADVESYTTQVSSLTNTVDGFNSTVANVDGRVSTLSNTVDGLSSTVSGYGGRISTVEQMAEGLQTTVASKADKTQITQLNNTIVLKADKTALSSKKDEYTTTITINGNGNTYYPLYFIKGDQSIPRVIRITRKFNDTAPGSIWNPSLPTHPGGINMEWVGNFGGWGGAEYEEAITSLGEVYATLLADLGREHNARTYAFYLRGGGAKYTISSDQPLNLKVGYSVNDVIFGTNKSSAPKTSVNRSRIDGLVTAQNSQISVLSDAINLRVTKGELLSQINIEAGRTLIQSDKLLLNATNTVITGTAWMDGAVIANASIDGAKIQDATIGSAKIANLDVNKISGNTTEFVRSYWNGYNSSVQLESSGMNLIGNSTWRRNILTATGIELYNALGGMERAGTIGYFKANQEEAEYGEHVMSKASAKHSVGIAANVQHDAVIGYNWSESKNTVYKRAIQVDGDTGAIRFFEKIHPNASSKGLTFTSSEDLNQSGIKLEYGNSGIYFTLGGGLYTRQVNGWQRFDMAQSNRITFTDGSRIDGYDGHLSTRAQGNRMDFYNWITQLRMSIRTNVDIHTNLSMQGNQILNTSDRRMKNIQGTSTRDSLTQLTNWNFVDYEWKDSNKPEGLQFGLIAQDTPELSIYDQSSDQYSISITEQAMITSHAVQQLAFKHDETNELAGQAYFLAETLADKMERLENRIEELERNVA